MNSTKSPSPHASDPQRIQAMFANIARRYDRANDLLSLGIHARWKRRVVREGIRLLETSRAPNDLPPAILDVATGTGDIAFEWERGLPHASVTGLDFTPQMLDIARAKAPHSRVRFVQGDALRLPFDAETFDIVTIGFGIRNVSDPVTALREFGRVLKPSGAILILEFGTPRLPIWSQCYKFYSNQVLPRIGGWVSGDRTAYQYLNSSSQAFPDRELFLKLAASALPGRNGQMKALAGGIAYLYTLR